LVVDTSAVREQRRNHLARFGPLTAALDQRRRIRGRGMIGIRLTKINSQKSALPSFSIAHLGVSKCLR